MNDRPEIERVDRVYRIHVLADLVPLVEPCQRIQRICGRMKRHGEYECQRNGAHDTGRSRGRAARAPFRRNKCKDDKERREYGRLGLMSSEYASSSQPTAICQLKPSAWSSERSNRYTAPSARPAATESTCPHDAEMKITAGFNTNS